MTQPASVQHLTYAEYLVAEQASATKHEYLRGEVFDMAGGTPQHSALAASMTIALGNALRGRPCRVFNSDLRIRIPETDFASYPDIAVVCTRLQPDLDDPNAIVNPTLVVEVLSDSTEAYDRGQKFAHYRRLPSLQEYVLVSQHEARIEVYRRNEAGRWELYESRSGEQVELASVGCKIDLDEIYRDPLAV
jgi:Uma2 family endonuclease